jgi:hypothetical protein
MRFAKSMLVIPVLALLAMSCAPKRHCPYEKGGGPCPGKPGMAMKHHGPHGWFGCGPEACQYKSKCFSAGAIHANSGVCQECSGGRWVAASGCRKDHDGKGKGHGKRGRGGHEHGHHHPHAH